jgi:general secretion pathway protein L
MTIQSISAALAGAAAILDQLGRWWIAELSALLPARWLQRRGSRIEARANDGFMELRMIQSSGHALSARLDLRNGAIEPRNVAALLAKRGHALPVWLYPPEAAILTHVLQIPHSAANQFDKLLRLEIDRWTPFSIDQIIVAWRRVGNVADQRAEVKLRFVPRASIEFPVKALAEVGLAPSLVVLGQEAEFHAALEKPSSGDGRWRTRKMLRLVLPLAALAFLLIDWASINRERKSWQERIAAERRLLVQQSGLESKIAGIAPVMRGDTDTEAAPLRAAFLSVLSATLPGTDWLSELSVRERNVILRGYSANVEILLKALEPLAAAGAVSVQGELAFDARVERQRFAVTFRIAEAVR